MFLEISNDIHLELKIGCCNAENSKLDINGEVATVPVEVTTY